MKYLYILILAVLTLASCGTDSGHFKLEGRLLNINQGEFYVYCPDGAMRGLDTIKVQAGRFTYTTECDAPKTLVVVFPNYTEQPVFAQPGKSVDIKGDASHLKELTVKGTKDNELMNKFREQIHSASPPEVLKAARLFAADHPESIVATYLVRRYFIDTSTPDFATAKRLLKDIAAKQPDNGYVDMLKSMVAGRESTPEGALPKLNARDINGSSVTTATLKKARTTVVLAWSTWNYTSVSMLRQLDQRAKASNGRIAVVGICLNPSLKQCRTALKSNDITTATIICDGRMVDGTAYNQMEMVGLPDNILIENGRIKKRSLTMSNLMNELDKIEK